MSSTAESHTSPAFGAELSVVLVAGTGPANIVRTMRQVANASAASAARSMPADDSATISTSMRRRAVCARRCCIVRTMLDGPVPATSTTVSSAEEGWESAVDDMVAPRSGASAGERR